MLFLGELDKKLRIAKESMEPYFRKYEKQNGQNIFKTVTSHFEPFKHTRTTIAQNRNTPSVSNAWIKIYELVSEFGLVPDEPPCNHFDNCSFPGSSVLAVLHYAHTMRDDDFRDGYNWFRSRLINRNYF